MGFPENQHPQQQAHGGQQMGQTVVVQQQPSNGLGMAGFICSLVGLFTCGVLFPIGLILSLIGVFFQPRGFAIAGLCISLGSIVLVVVCWFLFISALVLGGTAAATTLDTITNEINIRVQLQEKVQPKLTDFYAENQRMPNEKEFEELVGKKAEQYRFESLSETDGSITHWGRDKKFDTEDDREFDYHWNETTSMVEIN